MSFFCNECDTNYRKWVGMCFNCGNWNSVIEFNSNQKFENLSNLTMKPNEVVLNNSSKFNFNYSILDDFFSNNLQNSAVCVISGNPGTGKTTFLIDLLKLVSANNPESFMYISTEECMQQLVTRFFVGSQFENLYLSNAMDISDIFNILNSKKPKLVVVDSVQMLTDKENGIFSYSINSFKLILSQIVNFCKKNGIVIFLVSQVVKDGSLAGPKYLEHMVDVVLKLKKVGHKDSLVEISFVKNRFGSIEKKLFFKINELGINFEQNILINYKKNFEKIPGNCGAIFFSKDKIIFTYIQTLVLKNKNNNSVKRVTQNYNRQRLDVLLAVIEKVFSVSFSEFDIYISVDSGYEDQMGLDLAIVYSILSSFYNKVSNFLFFTGEVSLSGDVVEQDFKFLTSFKIPIDDDFNFCGNLINYNKIGKTNFHKTKKILEFTQLFK